MSNEIFINFRRMDSHGTARALCEALKAEFGEATVFFDADEIQMGDEWPERIQQSLEEAKVVIAVMGSDWLLAADEYARRLIDQESDWVHRELKTALDSGKPIIPLMVNGAVLAPKYAYPEALQALLDLQKYDIDTDQWNRDLEKLFEHLATKYRLERKSKIATTKPNDVTNTNWSRAHYLKTLASETQEFELLGNFGVNSAITWHLAKVYVPAMVQRIEQEDHFQDSEEAEKLLQKREITSVPLMNILDEHSIFLNGNPGSGKSVFCQWLAYNIAACAGSNNSQPYPIAGEQRDDTDSEHNYREALPADLRAKLPVLIRLRDFWPEFKSTQLAKNRQRAALETALANWQDMHEQYAIPAVEFKQLLEKGELLLILDGLDEVPQEYTENNETVCPRDTLLTALAVSIKHWHTNGNRVLITSRPYGIEQSKRGKLKIRSLDLLPLDDHLRSLFVHRCYQASDEKHPKQEARSLLKKLSGKEYLQELSSNPLSLTALVVKFREGRTLPEGIHALYDALLGQILYSRYSTARERKRVRNRLAVIANAMQNGGHLGSSAPPQATVPLSFIEKEISKYTEQLVQTEAGSEASQIIVEDLLSNSGLLSSASESQVSWRHQEFRDFLAAEYCDQRSVPISCLFNDHSMDRNWHRMLRFLFARENEIGKGTDGAIAMLMALQEPLVEIQHFTEKALLFADCCHIAFSDDAEESSQLPAAVRLREYCDASLERKVSARDRNNLWLVLSGLGWDTRSGVGLRSATGVQIKWPDIKWRDVNEPDFGSFKISEYLVTHCQYQAFLDDENGYLSNQWWNGMEEYREKLTDARWTEPTVPREQVNWYAASAFCRWLTFHLKDGEIGLPTGEEWKLAYVGGEDRDFPWRDDTDGQLHANYNRSELGRTSVVGIFPKGRAASGALDMAGNVFEWCSNAKDNKAASDDQGSAGMPGEECELRGGSFGNDQNALRSSDRIRNFPDLSLNLIGFRVVCRPH